MDANNVIINTAIKEKNKLRASPEEVLIVFPRSLYSLFRNPIFCIVNTRVYTI